ncbi:MAG: SpoIIE family protein phosphatase [Ilumatobacteraceae bacterium]|nr:SpoIIE family protein phosphatase [Ilumatobacteraceae bacterium]
MTTHLTRAATAPTTPELPLLQRIDVRRRTRDALLFCVVLIGYVAGAYFAFYLLDLSGLGAVFFVPAGITSAALLLSDRRQWPFVLAAAFLAEFYVDIDSGGFSMWSLLGFAAANTIEPVAGALIATRGQRRRIDIRRRWDLFGFMAGAVIIGPTIGGAIGGFTVFMGGGPFRSIWWSWGLGDSLGVLVVGGLLLTVFTYERGSVNTVETVVLIGLTTAFGFFLHWVTDLPIGFLAVVPLVVISARLGSLAAAATSVLVVAVAVTSWIPEDALVAGMEGSRGILLVKLQLWAMAAAGLLVAAESSERQSASALAGSRLRATEVLREALAPDPLIRSDHVDAEGISQSPNEELKVGGDWYDVVPLPDGRVAIMIGDVAGHGEEALITMGKLRFAASALSMFASEPGEIADALDVFARSTITRPYATAFFAIFDPARRELKYSTAGHPPAMLGAADGSWRWLYEGRSTPIGLPFPRARPSATVQLDGPATLVIYTDGVVERAGEIIDSGLARVFDAVVRSPDRPVADLVDEVTTSTNHDDTSFVRIRLRC